MKRPNELPPHLIERLHARKPSSNPWNNDAWYYPALAVVALALAVVIGVAWKLITEAR